ncbi:DNA (cytosine-5-)-methyltransferase, partial [Luminiphilus sp.]|nr:DNA (cytosine-5-)-methyltransferase [Luminiphilus sp.]
TKSISEIVAADLESLPEIDLLTAGFPCQSFSQAKGEVAGFNDERGQLFFDIPRVIALMPTPPKVVLLENVPTLKTLDQGAMLSTVINEMRFAGYWVHERNAQVLNSSEYGATPQRRERLFIVCVHESHARRNNFEFTKLQKKSAPNLFDVIDRSADAPPEIYLSKENKYFKMMNALAFSKGKDRLFQIRQVEARAIRENACPTLTANMGLGGHNVPFVFDDKGLRRLTVEECMTLQGFNPESFLIPKKTKDNAMLQMIGNAVSVGTVQNIITGLLEQSILAEVNSE